MFQEMVEGFVAALSGGLSTRAGEGAAVAASGAWKSLVQKVRRRLGVDPGASVAPAAVEQAPEDQDARAALVQALLRVGAEDPRFAEQFRSGFQRAQVEIHAVGGGIASQFMTINYLPLPDERATIPKQVRVFVVPFFNRDLELAALRRFLTGSRLPAF